MIDAPRRATCAAATPSVSYASSISILRGPKLYGQNMPGQVSKKGLGNIDLERVGCSPQCEGGEERGHAFYVIRCRISRELGSQIACVRRKKRLELAISKTVLEWVVWRMHC